MNSIIGDIVYSTVYSIVLQYVSVYCFLKIICRHRETEETMINYYYH